MLGLAYLREQFPAFAEPSLQGQAFFENAGGAYTCQPVIDRLFRFSPAQGAAFLAIAERCFGVSFSARALPPFATIAFAAGLFRGEGYGRRSSLL